MWRAGNIPGGGPTAASEFSCGAAGRSNPTAPAATITHAAFALKAPAARAAEAMAMEMGDRKTWRPKDHAAFRISAITTGPRPVTTLCNAGIE